MDVESELNSPSARDSQQYPEMSTTGASSVGSGDEHAASLPGSGDASGRPESESSSAGNRRTPMARRGTLTTCLIVAHTIEKRLATRKKALDPLRYMPERSVYYTVFTIAAHFDSDVDATDVLDGSVDPPRRHEVHRNYKQFCALHARLLKTYPKSNLPRELPTMRKKRYDNEYIEQKRQELTTYLAQLMQIPEVKASTVLREFLEAPPPLSDSSDDEDGLLVPSRMLEGLPGTIVTVRAGQSFSVTLPLTAAGDVASWQFTTKKHNIGFSATFEGEPVRAYSREGADVKPVKGFYRATAPGVCTLTWDNTYTWSKAKVLIYWAEVEQSHSSTANGTSSLASSTSFSSANSMDGGSFAASSGGMTPPANAAGPDSDSRRSGFIAQSRSSAMHPRRLVNSSISLITKPFAHGERDHDPLTGGKTRRRHHLMSRSSPSLATNSLSEQDQSSVPGTSQMEPKVGSLIIQRSVKFRGRNWYRKWFMLDPRKCVLRYYDSESAARRGLSLAKLNLANKHASLAITSSLSLDAAPTPYTFLIRTRKRCWKICASSQSEYNEWENAISTVILAAQLKRRSHSSKKSMRKAARMSATHSRKDTDIDTGAGKDETATTIFTATGSSMATSMSSLTTNGALSPVEESDDDFDDDFGTKVDEKDDDSDDDSESDSDSDSEDEAHASESESTVESLARTVTLPAEANAAVSSRHRNRQDPSAAVTVSRNTAVVDLLNLPLEWKFGLLAVLNVTLLSVRSAPAFVIVLALVAMDGYLLLKCMKRSSSFKRLSEQNLAPSLSRKAKEE